MDIAARSIWLQQATVGIVGGKTSPTARRNFSPSWTLAKKKHRVSLFSLNFAELSESPFSRTKHIFVQRSLWDSFCWNLLIVVCARTGPTAVNRNIQHDALSGTVKQERRTRYFLGGRAQRSQQVARCLIVSAQRSRADRSTWAPVAPAGQQAWPSCTESDR